MRIWTVAIAVVGMGAGCKYGPYEFTCTGDPSCGAGGICEANSFCSFTDSSCPSGRRYGGLSGPGAGQCVGGETPLDAGPPDARPDAGAFCYGSAPYTLCFTAAPTGAIDVSMFTTFDTVNGTVTGTQLNCATPMSGGGGYCVLAASTITIGAPLRAVSGPVLICA